MTGRELCHATDLVRRDLPARIATAPHQMAFTFNFGAEGVNETAQLPDEPAAHVELTQAYLVGSLCCLAPNPRCVAGSYRPGGAECAVLGANFRQYKRHCGALFWYREYRAVWGARRSYN